MTKEEATYIKDELFEIEKNINVAMAMTDNEELKDVLILIMQLQTKPLMDSMLDIQVGN